MPGFSRKDEQFRDYALNAPPLRVVLTVCTPLALYQALQQVFKILDSLMASHIGGDAVSAVSCLTQVTLMITALGSGLAVGGSVKISEAYGQGDYDLVHQRVATVYTMAILVSLVLAVTLVPFAEPFLRLLRTPETLIAAGTGYFRVEVLTLVVSFFNTVYIAIVRSRGPCPKDPVFKSCHDHRKAESVRDFRVCAGRRLGSHCRGDAGKPTPDFGLRPCRHAPGRRRVPL